MAQHSSVSHARERIVVFVVFPGGFYPRRGETTPLIFTFWWDQHPGQHIAQVFLPGNGLHLHAVPGGFKAKRGSLTYLFFVNERVVLLALGGLLEELG